MSKKKNEQSMIPPEQVQDYLKWLDGPDESKTYVMVEKQPFINYLNKSDALIKYAESIKEEQPDKSIKLLIDQLGEHLKLLKRSLA